MPLSFRPSLVAIALAVAIAAPMVASADQCPKLRAAVDGRPDYNNDLLGLHWFTSRGLNREGRYGCMAPQAGDENQAYRFALGCSCASHELCHSRNIDYSTTFDNRYSSRMGECKCCAWWVILLIVIGAILIIALILQIPRLRRWFHERNRRKRRAAMGEMADMEEGEVRHFSDLAQHEELNNSANDRRNSQLRARGASGARIRRVASTSSSKQQVQHSRGSTELGGSTPPVTRATPPASNPSVTIDGPANDGDSSADALPTLTSSMARNIERPRPAHTVWNELGDGPGGRPRLSRGGANDDVSGGMMTPRDMTPVSMAELSMGSRPGELDDRSAESPRGGSVGSPP